MGDSATTHTKCWPLQFESLFNNAAISEPILWLVMMSHRGATGLGWWLGDWVVGRCWDDARVQRCLGRHVVTVTFLQRTLNLISSFLFPFIFFLVLQIVRGPARGALSFHPLPPQPQVPLNLAKVQHRQTKIKNKKKK